MCYWFDQEDELIGHLGQRVEIKGEFEDVEQGIPASWFGDPVPDDLDVNFIARKVDVENVRALGACY